MHEGKRLNVCVVAEKFALTLRSCLSSKLWEKANNSVDVEPRRGGTTLQLPLLSLPLTPSSSLHSLSYSSCSCGHVPLSLSCTLSLSLSVVQFLPLFCLSLRHKDGWRHSWNGLHERFKPQGEQPQLHTAQRCFPPRPASVCMCFGGCGRGVRSGTVWQQMLLFGQKSERGLGWVGGLSRVRAQSHFSLLFLSLWPSFSVSPSPQLCLPWQLGKRKCEGNGVMEYVSGARGFGLFCGRLH